MLAFGFPFAVFAGQRRPETANLAAVLTEGK
jgi:hypothetical protein